MNRPDFFIVGAPKCGTSALYTYLRAHPRVFMPQRKEPRFFARDLDSGSEMDARHFVRTLDEYLELFADAGGADRIGEASALYLYSTEAAEAISRFDPAARIIIMVRDPVDLMHAFHSTRVYRGNEDIQDFALALDAEPDRRAGRRIPSHGAIRGALFYRDVARLSGQIERFLVRFDRSRIHFVVFDDLVSDTRRVYEGVLSFLDLPPAAMPELKAVNLSKRTRSDVVNRLLRRPPPYLRAAAPYLLPFGLHAGVKSALQRANRKKAKRSPLDAALRDQLVEEFRPEVERIGRIIGRDLSHWSRPASKRPPLRQLQ